jgi:hypothetical protein
MWLQAVAFIQAIEINAPGVRMRPGLVKAFNAASFAEQMLRSPRTEAIRPKHPRTGVQGKPVMRYDQVQKSGCRTNRTIAVEQLNFALAFKTKTHRATMASACYLHLWPSLDQR